MDAIDQRLANMYARGVLRHGDVKAGLARGQAELLKGEVRRLEMPTGFGLATSVPPGADVFAIFAGGNRDHGVIVAHDHRGHRPGNLAAGETALYSAVAGMTVHLKSDGTLLLKAPTKLRLEVGGNWIELTAGGIQSHPNIVAV